MEFDVIVSQVLPQVSGEGARGPWVRQEVIFEYPGDDFGRKVCISFWNDRAARAAAFGVGERVLIMANVESREHNGRWYTEVRAWRIEAPRAAVAPQAAAPAPAAQGTAYPSYANPTAVPAQTAAAAPAAAASNEVDDLPF